MLKNKIILITGGTGSFGKACIYRLLKYHQPKTIRVYSRDELKQWELQKELEKIPQAKKTLRFFIGDVRDQNRLRRATENVDYIIHAAALKQVPACEYNPIEAIRTNVDGAVNIIDAALDNNVKKVIALSTDKACQPINLYGTTKLCAEKLFIQANNYRGSKRECIFSVVRYGNVMGSRGSIVPLFLEQLKVNEFTVTDSEMTRFWITLEDGVRFVLSCLKIMQGAEVFIPKIPSLKITDIAYALAPQAKIKIIGKRPGEKLHESLISSEESEYTYDIGDRYLIAPMILSAWNFKKNTYRKMKSVDKGFVYNSETNPHHLSPEEIKKLISAYQSSL